MTIKVKALITFGLFVVMGQSNAETLSYYGGPIVPNAKVTMVDWTSDVPSDIQSHMEAFYADILTSDYWSILSQYDMADGKVIGSGSFKQVLSLTGNSSSGTVTDNDVVAEIGAKINAAASGFTLDKDASGNVNTIFMVHFPPGVTLNIQGSLSCIDFGATYENFQTSAPLGNAIVPIGFIPDCNGFDETIGSSFVLADIAADPQYFFENAWLDAMGHSAGDVCTDQDPVDITANGHTYSVELLWSNSTRQCVSTNRIFANGFEAASN